MKKMKIKKILSSLTLKARSRRGFSLGEMGLVLIVISMMMQTAIEVSTAFTKRQITQRTASTLSTVADDVETYLQRSYFDILADVNASPGRVVEADWNTLIASNEISIPGAPTSPDGGDPRLFFMRAGDTVYSVIMSFDNNNISTYSPRPDPSVRYAGKVQGHRPTTLMGWEYELDVSPIASLTGESLVGNVGVMRYVSQRIDVDPYLHRVVIPGRPELNQMQADLDMGGFDLNNARRMQTNEVYVQDEIRVDGRIEATTINSTGDARIDNINAQLLNSDVIEARSADFSAQVNASQVITNSLDTNILRADDATFENLAVEDFEGTDVFLATGNFVRIDVRRVDAEEIIADTYFIGD